MDSELQPRSPYPFSTFRISRNGEQHFDWVATGNGVGITMHDTYNGTKVLLADGMADDVAREFVRVLSETTLGVSEAPDET